MGNKEEVPYLANDSLQDQSLFLCNVLTEWLTTSSSTSATSGLRRRYPPWQSSWRPWVISRMNPRLKSNRLKAYFMNGYRGRSSCHQFSRKREMYHNTYVWFYLSFQISSPLRPFLTMLKIDMMENKITLSNKGTSISAFFGIFIPSLDISTGSLFLAHLVCKKL